jgi:hypothetical protein
VMLAASVAMLVAVAWSLICRIRGAPSPMWRQKNVPVWADFTVAFLGFVAVVSIVPGLVWGDPHWAIDHVYRLISRVL